MPTLVGSSTQPVPNGYGNPPNVTATFTLNTGDSVTWGHTSAQRGVGGTCNAFDSYLYQDGTSTVLVGATADWTDTNKSFSYTATGPIGLNLQLLIGGGCTSDPNGVAYGYHAETTIVSTNYCQHGTRLKAGFDQVVNLTPTLLDFLLARLGMGWLARALVQFYWQTLNVDELCGNGPPPLPTIGFGTLHASWSELLQILHAIAWPYFCECSPGAPTPVAYPVPAASQPTGWPAPLTFACTNDDLCVAIGEIQAGLANLAQTLGTTNSMVTLLQRYGLPFAYVPGPIHANLSGSIAFVIGRCVGVKVTVTELDSPGKSFLGVPTYIMDIGWLSIVTADGLVDEIRLTRQEQVWAPLRMPLAVNFAVALRDGVTVDVQELLAEP